MNINEAVRFDRQPGIWLGPDTTALDILIRKLTLREIKFKKKTGMVMLTKKGKIRLLQALLEK